MTVLEEWLMDNSPPETATFLMTMHRRGRVVAKTRDGVASGLASGLVTLQDHESSEEFTTTRYRNGVNERKRHVS